MKTIILISFILSAIAVLFGIYFLIKFELTWRREKRKLISRIGELENTKLYCEELNK